MARRLTLTLCVLLYVGGLVFAAPADEMPVPIPPIAPNTMMCEVRLEKCQTARNEFFYVSTKCLVAARSVTAALFECRAALKKQAVLWEVESPLRCTPETLSH